MKRCIFSLVMLAVLVSTGAAVAAEAPTWNGGYGWWPGGFGYAPTTSVMSGCSVTAYGPTFTNARAGWRQRYGGASRCLRSIGDTTLTVTLQVLGPHGRRWFTVSGSQLVVRRDSREAVHTRASRQAYLGHVYRTVVAARMRVPNGHAGCSLSGTCFQSLTVTVRSRRLAP